MSSHEKFVIAEKGEEFVTLEAFEHPGEELADIVLCTSDMEEQILPE